jgi:NAD(P)-dependent dehydrogenase (short-subunit alcohol dehydrogenase family)
MRLKDKTAIVTGGGAGMGQAVAKGFAREGAKVVVADVNSGDGQATVAAIRQAEGEAIFVRADVSKPAEVEALAAAAVEQYGRIDILYNNAAIQLHGQDARAHELSEEVWDRTYAINIRGVWLCSKYVIPVMLAQGGGSIIQVASPTGLTGCAPGYTAYSSSKGGVIALTRVMAVDYARDGIRVNAIVPGATETPLIAELLANEHTRQALAAMSPIGRLGRPEDVVGLAIFLASDESGFCTGGIYMADGGLTAI